MATKRKTPKTADVEFKSDGPSLLCPLVYSHELVTKNTLQK